MDWLDKLLGNSPKHEDRSTTVLSWLVGSMALVILILFALGQSLRLPAHLGVEDWLAWHGTDTLAATLRAWSPVHGSSRVPAAAAYLLIDTALFMPLYGLTLLWAIRQVRGTLQRDGPMAWPILALSWAAVPLLLMLWCVDAIENLGGLTRVGIHWAWGLGALALAARAYWLVRRWAISGKPRDSVVTVGWLILSLLIVSVASYLLEPGSPNADGIFSGWAHGLKQGLVPVALIPLVGFCLCWWFGLDLDSTPKPGRNDAGEIRSAYRQVAVGVIGRSRYVLALLALFAAFTVVLDQCRDVLLALATTDFGLWWVITMAIGALGLAMLSHACWLWTRLVGRVKRSGYEVSACQGVADWAGEWARSWARLLMLVPLLMTSVLIANVAGDAVIAAQASQAPGLFRALLVLASFEVAIVGLALWMMRQRRQSALDRPSDYYNSVSSVRPLLHDPHVRPDRKKTDEDRHRHSRVGDAINVLAQPIWQPLVALALLLAVRTVMLLWPDVSGTAPPALAVLAMSLVWWLGPLGLIAMSEQRAVFPWALLLLIVAGVMGFASDNHTLPALVIEDSTKVVPTLAALGRVALSALWLLAALSALVWLVLVFRSRQLLGWLHVTIDKEKQHIVADRLRTSLCLAGIGVLCAGLFGFDHWAASVMGGAEGAERPAQHQLTATAEPEQLPAQDPLLLVASEGGGVRAAYWTARVLAAMEKEHPGWDSRIVAMSGVSGGSMGIAVWRACVRDPRGQRNDRGMRVDLEGCVKDGFRNIDALSPLLGGLLFEDIWMRLLPTDWLCKVESGCGMRSRAMAFEREWMRAFPRLAQPLALRLQGEPDLLLNSTVVESGNRGVLSTRHFEAGELPGAEDLMASRRLTRSPALITAAHTSARFPVSNPLASLPHQDSGPAAAHLVDGGYHDNSGTASLADVLTRLRANYPMRRVQLVLIRNGQVPANCLPQALQENQNEPKAKCLETGPDASDLLPPRDAQRLRLFADLLGPVVTVLNNLGTGAHGREPVAALTAQVAAGAELPSDKGCTNDSPVCLLDQMQDASLVPLGWSLSPAARAAMDTAAEKTAAGEKLAVK